MTGFVKHLLDNDWSSMLKDYRHHLQDPGLGGEFIIGVPTMWTSQEQARLLREVAAVGISNVSLAAEPEALAVYSFSQLAASKVRSVVS